MVLLAVPALAILLYLYHKGSGSLRDPDSASLTIITKTQLRDYSNALSDAQWARQEGQLRQCRLQWFQSGTICPNPPRQWSRQNKLDAVWPWSNGSLDSSQTDQSYLASMDLLRYSMRSARAHMQTGFGTVNLLTPDVPALAARASTSPEKQQFCTHLYKDASGHDRHGQRPCWFDPKDRVYEPPRLFHHRQVAAVDLNTLHAHYMAERYREALLWSFFVARHDRDGDGVYSAEERAALLSELGAPDPQKPVIAPAAFPVRTTTENDTLNANLARLHLPLMTELKPIRTSMDGSALLTPHTPAQVAAAEKLKPGEPQPPICGLSGECVQTLFANVKKPPSVAELFRRMTQAAPNCGQCVLYHLTHKSGLQGLSAFLPPPELTMASIDHLPLVSTWQISDFTIKASPSSRQARRLDVVIDLLSRYSHSFVYEEPRVTPTLLNRTQTVNTLMFLDNDPVSSLFSFKQHGVYTEQTPDERHHWAFSHGFRSEFEPEDPMIWVKIVRAWLSTKFPFLMRFEAKCNGIC
uniref:EF-hand domain-containing protein n=1 Tax=Kalmanozyma brasiliensis (strain GHG001) TaxID=1365824 RepID=V5EXB6_KALBG